MKKSNNPPFVFPLFLVVSFAFLLVKLFTLQVVSGAENSLRSEQNRIDILPVLADRGVIYDRSGEILVRNKTEGREYVLGPTASHILGYVGEANEDEVEAFAVALGSVVGKMGVERAEDKILRGTDGGVIVETDSVGNKIRELSRKEPVAGRDIRLFMDTKLQKIASEELSSKKGAIVVTTPAGEVLSLASSPSFDPNVFNSRQPAVSDRLLQVFNSPDQPMFNRAIAGLYPPGSTFKIVTATAGLETGAIRADEEISDTGEIRIGKFRYGNWYFDQYGRKEGMVNMVKAFQRSNDIYFYRVGERLGITRLSAWAKAFGFGQPTGILLSGEADGLAPDSEWKEKEKKEAWYLGDTYITAIGQGDLQTTPLQVNQMTAVIANGGKLCKPRVVKSQESGESCKELPIGEKTIAVIKEGMKRACEPGGTGWPLFNFKIKNEKLKIDGLDFSREASGSADIVRISTACKTGTAEYGDPQEKTHAWFTVFAPVNNPEIVVTVLLEQAGQGSDKAAPVAKKILEEWFGE